MSMNDFTNLFGSAFSLLWSTKMLGTPVLFWLIMLVIFGVIASFIKGKKGD